MTDNSPHSPRPAPPDWEALARFLAGEASPEEAAAVARWMGEHPQDERLLSAMGGPLDRLRAAPPAGLDVEVALERVHARMASPGLTVTAGGAAPAAPAALHSQLRSRWLGAHWRDGVLRAAAAIAVLAGGALLARHFLARGASDQAVTASTFRTGVGERDSVALPDGTRVLLGPGSSLALAEDYASSRRVVLRGEALFDVRHDTKRPFTVAAGGAVIQDVGTRFDVRADDPADVRVTVFEGSVSVRNTVGSLAVVVGVGHSASVRGGQVSAPAPASAGEDLAWTRGELVFRGAPLTEVAAALRRWYGVQLRTTDPGLERRHLTTTLSGEPRQQALEIVALALGARLEMHGDTAVLRTGDGDSR